MQLATTIAIWVVRLAGITQVVLGLGFWTGRGLGLLNLHMLVGGTFVLAVWVLTGLAARSGLRWLLVAGAAGWGGLVIWLGINQMRLLPGPAHWVVEVLHLLVGIAAMVIAARLAAYVRHQRGAETPERAAAPGGLGEEMPMSAEGQ